MKVVLEVTPEELDLLIEALACKINWELFYQGRVTAVPWSKLAVRLKRMKRQMEKEDTSGPEGNRRDG